MAGALICGVLIEEIGAGQVIVSERTSSMASPGSIVRRADPSLYRARRTLTRLPRRAGLDR